MTERGILVSAPEKERMLVKEKDEAADDDNDDDSRKRKKKKEKEKRLSPPPPARTKIQEKAGHSFIRVWHRCRGVVVYKVRVFRQVQEKKDIGRRD